MTVRRIEKQDHAHARGDQPLARPARPIPHFLHVLHVRLEPRLAHYTAEMDLEDVAWPPCPGISSSLPTLWPDSMRRCACAASASG